MSYAPMRSRGVGSYAAIGLETSINSASPEKLISLLFEGARSAIRKAEQALAKGDIAGRGMATSKAIDIVSNGLRASLNLEAGGEIAENLYRLYVYIEQCLLEANLNADPKKLTEAEKLLSDIGGAWNEMAKGRPA